MKQLFHSAQNSNHSRLDLYNLITFHPEATFYFKYEGPDLYDFNINRNDVLVIDRSLNPKNGNLIISVREGEFVIEKFSDKKEIDIWGVISFVVHKLI